MNETPLSPPPEWALQSAIWIGWPSDPDVWGDALAGARDEVAGLVEVIASHSRSVPQTIHLLASGAEAVAAAKAKCGHAANVVDFLFWDVWLRDTGSIFSVDHDGRLRASCFRFNGWGGKYLFPSDRTVSRRMAFRTPARVQLDDFILEGGALDWDGRGAVLTTRECLLNPNRNSGWDQETAESALAGSLGLREVIWLERGLANDHTDGHVDNLARFVPGTAETEGVTVVCQSPSGNDDPNATVLDEVFETLTAAELKTGATLSVRRIPSPGLVQDNEGQIMAASHMNFVITNVVVVVPAYNDRAEAAVEALIPLFPDRVVVARPARHLLTGGGAFHCISQQQPALGQEN